MYLAQGIQVPGVALGRDGISLMTNACPDGTGTAGAGAPPESPDAGSGAASGRTMGVTCGVHRDYRHDVRSVQALKDVDLVRHDLRAAPEGGTWPRARAGTSR